MATHGWGTNGTVEEWLFAEGYRFDFFQAVRLLELIYPQRSPVGENVTPRYEVVRFRSSPSLAFAPSEIADIVPSANGSPAEMTVNFLGLAGSMGPLPTAYTELVLERIGLKDTSMRDFLDMFNHRLVSLLYRARKLYRVGLDPRSPEKVPTSQNLYALIGLGTSTMQGRMPIPDRTLLYYSGIVAGQSRTMSGLEAILSDCFKVKVRGQQMTGRWLSLSSDQTTRIGTSGENNALGTEVVLGSRVWDQPGKFDLHIGPIDFTQSLDFLPGQRGHIAISALTRFYAGEEFDFDLVLHLRPQTLPPLALGGSDARLGWTSWMVGTTRGSGFYTLRLSSSQPK